MSEKGFWEKTNRGATSAERKTEEKIKEEVVETPNMFSPELMHKGDLLNVFDSSGGHMFKITSKTSDGHVIAFCVSSKIRFMQEKTGILDEGITKGLPVSLIVGKDVFQTNSAERIIRNTKNLNPFELQEGNSMRVFDENGGWTALVVTKLTDEGEVFLHCIAASEENQDLIGHKGVARSFADAGSQLKFGQHEINSFQTPTIRNIDLMQGIPTELLLGNIPTEAFNMQIDSSGDRDRFTELLSKLPLRNLKMLYEKINVFSQQVTDKISLAKGADRKKLMENRRVCDIKITALVSELAARREGKTSEPEIPFPEKALTPREEETIKKYIDRQTQYFQERKRMFEEFWQELKSKEKIDPVTDSSQIMEMKQFQAVFLGIKPSFDGVLEPGASSFLNAIAKNRDLLVRYGFNVAVADKSFVSAKGVSSRSMFVYNEGWVSRIASHYNASHFKGYDAGMPVENLMKEIVNSQPNKDYVRKGLISGFPLGAVMQFRKFVAGEKENGKIVDAPGILYRSQSKYLTPRDAEIIERHKEAFLLSGIEDVPLN